MPQAKVKRCQCRIAQCTCNHGYARCDNDATETVTMLERSAQMHVCGACHAWHVDTFNQENGERLRPLSVSQGEPCA